MMLLSHQVNRDHGSDRGAMALELIILVPVIVMAIGFLAWAGRQPAADGEVRAVAQAAARAASLERDVNAAVAAGTAVGTTAAGLEVCVTVTVVVDTSRWQQGWVSATATCDVNNQGLVIFDGGSLQHTWSEKVHQAGRV